MKQAHNFKNLIKSDISKLDQHLDNSNFSNSGKERFKETVSDYASNLFETSTLNAQKKRVDGYENEVTDVEVVSAKLTINDIEKKSQYELDVFKYICTALVAIGASNLDKNFGVPLLIFGFIGGVTLIIKSKSIKWLSL